MLLYQHTKNQLSSSASKKISLFHLFIYEMQPILESYELSSQTHLSMLTPKIFCQLLIVINLYQYAKNQAISSIYSGVIVNLKILQSDWLGAFWPICQERDYFQTWNLFRNIASNTNFYWGTNFEKKLKTKFFNKFKKAYFRSISPIFWANFFSEKPGSSRTISYGFLAPCQNLEKTRNA